MKAMNMNKYLDIFSLSSKATVITDGASIIEPVIYQNLRKAEVRIALRRSYFRGQRIHK